jgi:hypothetical protein
MYQDDDVDFNVFYKCNNDSQHDDHILYVCVKYIVLVFVRDEGTPLIDA